MEITAAVLREPDQPYSLEQLTLADPGPGEVLVAVKGVGMCHTDVLPRLPGMPIPRPIVCGHEGSGVVEAVGAGVTAVAPGDHVVCSFDSCGGCDACHEGHPAYCSTFMFRNLTGWSVTGTTSLTAADGTPVGGRWFGQSTFATHAIATERNVVKVDPSLPLELLGPLGCGIQTGAGSVLVALAAKPGSSIAVFGTGAVGLAAVMGARVAGCRTIVGVDVNPARLELAMELGATHTIDGRDPDLVAKVQALSGGEGLDLSFDTTGNPDVMHRAVEVLRSRGVCGLVGVQTGPLVIEPNLIASGKTITGILEGDAVPQVLIPQLIALWQQGRFPFDELVKTYPLAEIDEAERAALAGEVVKPVLLP